MAAELVWRRQARDDLIDIGLIIARENPAAAARILGELEARVEALRRFPRLGVRREDINRALRVLIVWPYLILYRTSPSRDNGAVRSVQLVRVIDGRRDLAALARSDGPRRAQRSRTPRGSHR